MLAHKYTRGWPDRCVGACMYVNICVRGQVRTRCCVGVNLGVWVLPCHHLLSGMNFRFESSMQSCAFANEVKFF